MDMITLVPRRYAEACASSVQIKIIDSPLNQTETIEYSMLWHSRAHGDPGGDVHESLARLIYEWYERRPTAS
jgi:hypothetical protein